MSSIEKAIDKLNGAPQIAKQVPEMAAQKPAQNAPEAKSPSKNLLSFDFKHLKKLGMLVPGDDTTAIAEEYRMIKRPLIQNLGTLPDHPNLIMVTSTMPSEGKTFSSVNLAISMAMEFNTWVMLVDFDFAKSGITKLLDIKSDLGVVNVLTDSSLTLPDVIFNTNVDRLSILPAGNSDRSATELIASSRTAELMQELSSRYPDRIVIFDAPPMLATSETFVLSELMGQIVLVVESNKTPRHLVVEAVNQLSHAPYLGLLLNKSNRTNIRYYHGYGYGRKK